MRRPAWGRAIAGVCAVAWVACAGQTTVGRDDAKVHCCQGKPVRWRDGDLPLTVWFDPTLPASHIETYRLISDQINRLAGLIVFRNGIEAPPLSERVVIPRGHVLIRADGALRSATTSLQHEPHSGVLKSATVTMPEMIESYQLRYLMVHELLHVLGYDHGEATARAQMAILRAAMDLEFIRMDYGDPAPAAIPPR